MKTLRLGTAGVTFNGINLPAAYAVFHYGLVRRSQRPQDHPIADPDDEDYVPTSFQP
jgi:hypothetical protein